MINITQRANQAIQLAGEIAYKYSCTEVGTEHLLYGLCAVKNCIASKILQEFNITDNALEQVFKQTYQLNLSTLGAQLQLTKRSLDIMHLLYTITN